MFDGAHIGIIKNGVHIGTMNPLNSSILWGCPWIILEFKHIGGLGNLFSKVSLTLRKFKQFVEVPQVCLRSGADFFDFARWL